MSDKKEFYTDVSVRYGKVYYRGYEYKNGVKSRVQGKIPFSPTLYLETKEDSEYQSLYGQLLKPKKFDGIPAAREFAKQYKDVMRIYGYAASRWEYEFIARNFPEVMQVTLDELKVVGFDIETKVGVNGPPGIPDPYDALEEITHIAFEDHATGAMVSYTTANVTKTLVEGCPIVHFDTEEELLEAIITYFRTEDPDIIYGFYSDRFDLPYIINRIRNVLGEDEANRLSPFGIIDEREYELNEEVHKEYTIAGRTHFDTQAMYKKFVLTKQEKYSLDHLSKVELGVGKLENPCATFKQFSEAEEHIDTFAEYNIIDTKRLTQLDKKTGLLELAVSLTYLMKCNFSDVFSPVRYWECYIMSTLANENKFVEISKQRNSISSIPGAYVHDPIPGFYKWIISIDAAALYPSIMKCLNLSPETLVEMIEGVNVDAFLSGKNASDFGVSEEFSLAANGAKFHKRFRGIVPRLVDDVLDGRKIAKKEMLRLKQLYVDTKDTSYKKQSDLQNILQGALKVAANSFYGVFLQQGFMFYDPRIGEAITLTGQYILKKVSSHCDKRFNVFFKTDDVKYAIYMDTDSVFFTLEEVVKKYWPGQTDLKIVDALDKLMETKLRKYIDEATDEIAATQQHYTKTIFFKRENICSGGFWKAKKMYALKVYDSEGVRYPDGDYKIMGIEVVRSSTPQLARDRLKESIKKIIDGDIDGTRKIAEQTFDDYQTAKISEIAFPRGANNLAKYRSDSEYGKVYTKGTPIAVRASLLYNRKLKELNLYDRYDGIGEGDKIKFIYLNEPNPIQEDVIAFIDELPTEFKLDKYIDRRVQYEKTFQTPLESIFNAIGWKLVEESTLDDFF